MKFISFFFDGPRVLCVLLEKTGLLSTILDKVCFDQDLIGCRHYIQYIKYTYPDCVFVTGLDIREVSLKQGQVPKARGKELQKLLHFELEKHSMFSQEDSVSAASFFSKGPKNFLQDVTFSICSKKSLDGHLQKVSQLGITPSAITTAAQGVYRYCQKFIGLEDLLAIDISPSSVQMVLILSNKVVKACEISLEKNRLDTHGFWQECDKFFFRCFKDHEKKQIDLITFQETSFLSRLLHLLQEHGVTGVVSLSSEDSQAKQDAYAIPIGMCLDAAAEDRASINLAFDRTPIFKSYKKKLKTFAFSMTALAALLSFFSSSFFAFKEQNLDSKFCSLLIDVAGKNKYSKLALEELDAFEKAQILEKQLRLAKKNLVIGPSFSLIKILDDFEILIKKEKLTGSLSNISYEMISYPTVENKKASYEARVHLEFKTPAFISLKQNLLPSYWHQFSTVKKGECYEISFVAKDVH